jgi:hypothetical protein
MIKISVSRGGAASAALPLTLPNIHPFSENANHFFKKNQKFFKKNAGSNPGTNFFL